MDPEQIASGIARWQRWHYEFDLRGQLTPIHDVTRVNRHRQRKSLFFDPLVALAGGSLRGMRVLDLGCNAGYWALQAIEAGCDFVYGIDARQMHIDQASFVFETLGVDERRYEFETANVFEADLARNGPYDLVLFLGLLYHIAKPVEMMERINEVSNDLLIIDTRVLERTESVFEIVHEGTNDPRNAVDYGVVMRPSRTAVTDLVTMFGYQSLMLDVRFADYTGASDYATGLRKAYICSKRTSLAALEAAIAD